MLAAAKGGSKLTARCPRPQSKARAPTGKPPPAPRGGSGRLPSTCDHRRDASSRHKPSHHGGGGSRRRSGRRAAGGRPESEYTTSESEPEGDRRRRRRRRGAADDDGSEVSRTPSEEGRCVLSSRPIQGGGAISRCCSFLYMCCSQLFLRTSDCRLVFAPLSDSNSGHRLLPAALSLLTLLTAHSLPTLRSHCSLLTCASGHHARSVRMDGDDRASPAGSESGRGGGGPV